MTGFLRTRMPASHDRATLKAAIVNFIGEREIAEVLRCPDPFLIEHDCLNPAGHDPIASCGNVVCCHCSRVFGS